MIIYIMNKKFNPFNYSIYNHINMIIFILTYLYNKIYNINNDNDDNINKELLYDFIAFYIAIFILVILIYKISIYYFNF